MAAPIAVQSPPSPAYEMVYHAPMMKTFEEIASKIDPQHFASQEYLLKFLSDGYVVDGKKCSYTEDELERIHQDYLHIYDRTFKHAQKEPLYVVTAGGPGAGKSTLLETVLGFKRDSSPNSLVTNAGKFAYIDPDRAALFFMKNTYCGDVQKGDDPTVAYNKWRGPSNFIASMLLAIALKEGYAIAHGTTMTAPPAVVKNLLTKIATVYKYAIEMHHVTAPDQIRVDSVKARNTIGIVQETGDDLVNKGKALFERLPLYLEHVPTIHFWLRASLGNAVVVATQKDAIITILDRKGYSEVMRLHITKGQ